MKKIVVGDKYRVGAWVAARTGRTAPWGVFEAFGVEQDGQLIGGFVVDNYIQGVRCSLHAAGSTPAWTSRELFFVVFDYIFRQLGCGLVMNVVNVDNTPSMIGTARIGFTEVHRIPDGAGSCDLAIFVMRKAACRWLHFRRG